MKCDIIIPVWNELEHTQTCIENIIKNTGYPYHIIVVDNASDEPTKRYLEGLKKARPSDITLIRNSENLGFVKAVNQALKISSTPYVCIMNNDTIPAPGWLNRMVDFAESHKDVGLINPQCSGHLDASVETYAKALEKNRGIYMEMNQCQGFCMLVKRELIDKIGYLDEAFGIGGFDDTDYSMRAHIAGYKSVCIYDAYVYHRLHASFDKAGNREAWVRRNQKIYYDKWGKHLRIGVAYSLKSLNDNAVSDIVHYIYGLAREWSWVHLWVNSSAGKDAVKAAFEKAVKDERFPLHQNIRINYFNMPDAVFKLTIAGKTIERINPRMRQKRFDAVVVSDKSFTLPLRLASKAVGASVFYEFFSTKSADWEKRGRELALLLKEGRGK